MSQPKNPADLPDQTPETRLVTGGRDARSTAPYPTVAELCNDRGELIRLRL